MQHDLVRVVLCVGHVTLAPVVPYSICKDGAARVELRGSDATTHLWVSLKTMFGIFVPEVESAVATSSAEGSMLGMERDIVNREYLGRGALRGLAMTLEREVGAVVNRVSAHF